MRSRKLTATERQEQTALIQWWDQQSKLWRLDNRLLFAIPNGAVLAGDKKKRAMQMNHLKAEGLRVGMFDLMLAVPRFELPAGGLFVEMKSVDGRSSSEQIALATVFRQMGYHVVIAYGFEEAKRAINGYLAGRIADLVKIK